MTVITTLNQHQMALLWRASCAIAASLAISGCSLDDLPTQKATPKPPQEVVMNGYYEVVDYSGSLTSPSPMLGPMYGDHTFYRVDDKNEGVYHSQCPVSEGDFSREKGKRYVIQGDQKADLKSLYEIAGPGISQDRKPGVGFHKRSRAAYGTLRGFVEESEAGEDVIVATSFEVDICKTVFFTKGCAVPKVNDFCMVLTTSDGRRQFNTVATSQVSVEEFSEMEASYRKVIQATSLDDDVQIVMQGTAFPRYLQPTGEIRTPSLYSNTLRGSGSLQRLKLSQMTVASQTLGEVPWTIIEGPQSWMKVSQLNDQNEDVGVTSVLFSIFGESDEPEVEGIHIWGSFAL